MTTNPGFVGLVVLSVFGGQGLDVAVLQGGGGGGLDRALRVTLRVIPIHPI